MKRGFSVEWYKHLSTDAERKEFEALVRNDTQVLSRLRDILVERLRGIEIEEMSLASYENPSWSHKQAHLNGVKSGLAKTLALLDFLK